MVDPVSSLAVLAVDAASGAIAEKLMDPVVEAAWNAFKPVLYPWWDAALHEVRLGLREAVDELHRRDRDAVDALVRSFRRGEANALVTGFVRAAAQATTEERMRMIAAACAGTFTPEMESDTRARVLRTVDQLQPSDVVALLSMIEVERLDPSDRHGTVRGEDIDKPTANTKWGTMNPLERQALTTSGCVTVAFVPMVPRVAGPSGTYQAHVTELGHAVAHVVGSWKPGPSDPT